MKVFLFFLSLHVSVLIQAQGFSFSCARDTTIPACSSPCVDLSADIPDLHSATSDYSVEPLSRRSCFSPYIMPDNFAGVPTSLTRDDRYSSAITLPFTFPFYGAAYNQLIVSTNGLVSFDITKANAFSHFGIILNSSGSLGATATGTPLDLPSSLYDKALIMGPYHDLNPFNTTSPLRRIQYQVVGTAPYRKWILSFYKIPLFFSSCASMIENTHQIVLYESTGLIEVFVYSQENCLGWNQGRAMIGLMNMNRDAAVMAPGRKASDAPWGTINMNESWRFVPNAGTSLFKRVELYDLAGNLVSTGTTTNGANGNLKANFTNVCGAPGLSTYVIKSVYQKIDDANVEIAGLDTIRVTRQSVALAASTTVQPTFCGTPTGSITVNVATGNAPYQYSLNSGAFQTSNVFNGLAEGNYSVVVKDAAGCTQNLTASVPLQNNLTVTTINDTTVCAGSSFVAQTTSNGSSFSWSPAAGVSNTQVQSPQITALATNRYIVTAQLGSCTAKDSFDLTVNALPAVNAGTDRTIIAGDTVQLNATATSGTYLWSPAAGLTNATILNPVAQPNQSTVYRLSVTTTNGCSASDDITITVLPYCIKPMQAFTPNGDGMNDVWKITDGNCITAAKAQVYDRYGAKVFEAGDYKNNWNGSVNGRPLPDGTYYYVLTYTLINGKSVYLKGNVTILR